MERNRKILVDEETLEQAFEMLGKLKHHYFMKSRKAEIERRDGWEQKEDKYHAKAAEVEAVYVAIAEALEAEEI